MSETTQAKEARRREYKPRATAVLFIGESPPSGETFFYDANSKLYRETKRAFQTAVPDLMKPSFLKSFQQLGCYLDDLCLEPVNQLKETAAGKKRLAQTRKAGENPLAVRIRAAQPRALVLIGLGIERNVRRAARRAGHAQTPFYPLPFPNWQRDVDRFHNGLCAALVELRTGGALEAAAPRGS